MVFKAKKNTLLLLILYFLNGFIYPLYSQETQEIEKEKIERLASAFYDFDSKKREQVWPHFYLLSYPAIFHFKSGNLYAFGLKSPIAWDTFLTHPLLVLSRLDSQDPIHQWPLHPSYLFEEQPVFIFELTYAEDQNFAWLSAFIREKFRLFQSQIFHIKKTEEGREVDYQNVTQLAWIELENRLLKRAIEVPFLEKKREYLKDYIAVNQTRRQELSRESIQKEEDLQQKEGLAEYVSLKTFQILPIIPQFNFEQGLLDWQQKKTNSQLSLVQAAMKERHCFVGMTLAWALDLFSQPTWKYAIQYRQFSLQQLLERALVFNSQEKEKRIADLKNQGELAIISQDIQLKLGQEKVNLELISQHFDQQPGTLVRLGLPPCEIHTKAYRCHNFQFYHLKVLKKVILLSSSYNSLWTLRLKNIPVCLEEPTGERIFKLSHDINLIVDGQAISLKKIEKLPETIFFRSLAWKNLICDFDTTCPGKIMVQPQYIQIIFDQ